MVGSIFAGFEEHYDGCTHFGAQTGGEGCTIEHFDPSCPRIVKVPIYSTDTSNTVVVNGFAAFLLESQTNDGYITGSFLHTITSGSSSGDSAGTGSDYGLNNLLLSE